MEAKIFKKKIFLVSTEVGRVKGKISFYIAEIVPNKGLRLIDNDFTCSQVSNAGIDTEVVRLLVKKGELNKSVLNDGDYRKGNDDSYILIVVEGRGLNYINQLN